jgi:hypothetical protein
MTERYNPDGRAKAKTEVDKTVAEMRAEMDKIEALRTLFGDETLMRHADRLLLHTTYDILEAQDRANGYDDAAKARDNEKSRQAFNQIALAAVLDAARQERPDFGDPF